jgi:hypothetical protein
LQDVRDFYKFKQYLLVTRVYSDPLAGQPAAAAAGPSSGKPPAGPRSKQQQPQQQQAKKQKGEQQQQQQVRVTHGSAYIHLRLQLLCRALLLTCFVGLLLLQLPHCWRGTTCQVEFFS